MQTIPIDRVQAGLERLGRLPDAGLEPLFRRFSEEQPELVRYLLRAGEGLPVPETRDSRSYLGLVIFELMAAESRLPLVTEAQLHEAEAANARFFEQAELDVGKRLRDAEFSFLPRTNQLPLFGAVLSALVADYSGTPEEMPDGLELEMLYLKTVIDCLEGGRAGA